MYQQRIFVIVLSLVLITDYSLLLPVSLNPLSSLFPLPGPVKARLQRLGEEPDEEV